MIFARPRRWPSRARSDGTTSTTTCAWISPTPGPLPVLVLALVPRSPAPNATNAAPRWGEDPLRIPFLSFPSLVPSFLPPRSTPFFGAGCITEETTFLILPNSPLPHSFSSNLVPCHARCVVILCCMMMLHVHRWTQRRRRRRRWCCASWRASRRCARNTGEGSGSSATTTTAATATATATATASQHPRHHHPHHHRRRHHRPLHPRRRNAKRKEAAAAAIV